MITLPVISERHRDLVAKLIVLEHTDTDRANEIRWLILEYERTFPQLERTRIDMMSKKIKQEN